MLPRYKNYQKLYNNFKLKIPKFFIFCDLPKTATGKIRKVELREQAKDI